MNINNVLYTGILIHINNIPYHITLDFLGKTKRTDKMKILENFPFNELVEITITHYGQYAPNGKLENVAYKVELPKSINKLFKGKIPHITIATYNNGKAVNSYKCFTDEGLYTPLSEPVTLDAICKCFNHKNEPIYIAHKCELE